ncbi:hypothetical protein VP1G_10617 [Cytospora mali]|uniref:Uncharacterized protein n=1 Tax=Cytospora mali TaxID=578113 RepID=A0A194UR37_CYTMA|nr:hypothetical protein VP1G_10617 [Valsa mali var. pyri (nom. inval.)]
MNLDQCSSLIIVWLSTFAISSALTLATLAPAKDSAPSARLESAGGTQLVVVGLCTVRNASPMFAPFPLSFHAPDVGDWRPGPAPTPDAVDSARLEPGLLGLLLHLLGLLRGLLGDALVLRRPAAVPDRLRQLVRVLLRGGLLPLGRGRRVQRRGRVRRLVLGLLVLGHGRDGPLGRLRELVVVDLDVLFELAIFVPLLNLDHVLKEKEAPRGQPRMRALLSTAMSTALKGTRFARRMVSSREVAVTMCMFPAVREV